MPTANHAIKAFLKRFGLEVRRIEPPASPVSAVSDPLEAMFLNHAGETTAVQCSMDDCVIFNGFSFGKDAWHPFVAAAQEKLENPSQTYKGSILERFYQAWRPTNAFESLIGLSNGPEFLKSYPPHTMHFPWLEPCPDARRRAIEKIMLIENQSFGGNQLTIRDGYGLQGPVSVEKGKLEYQRLINVLNSINEKGFDRTYGDSTAQVLKRGSEFRFRIAHGHHRIAALAALGYTEIPIIPTMIVDYQEAEHWPQVYRGLWAEKDALSYFHHHFDFCSREWADSILGFAS